MIAALTRRFAQRLRFLADRLDDDGAFRCASPFTYTFEQGRGIVLREDGKGCPIWYRGRDDHERAHTEADDPPVRIDWSTMTTHPPGTNLREV